MITGSRKGIGRHLVSHFLERGAQVVGCSREPADQSAENYTHFCLDVADEEAVRHMVAWVSKQHGRLDILINNAGAAAMNHFLLTPMTTIRNLLDVNFLGTFLLSREAAKLMRRHEYGRIVNISTIAVPMHLGGEAAYVASKSAVEGLTRVMARELAPFNITCNLVAPAPIETDLIQGVPRKKINAIVERLAIKRLGTFADVINVIDFFVKPESDYITGQIIYLGGV